MSLIRTVIVRSINVFCILFSLNVYSEGAAQEVVEDIRLLDKISEKPFCDASQSDAVQVFVKSQQGQEIDFGFSAPASVNDYEYTVPSGIYISSESKQVLYSLDDNSISHGLGKDKKTVEGDFSIAFVPEQNEKFVLELIYYDPQNPFQSCFLRKILDLDKY